MEGAAAVTRVESWVRFVRLFSMGATLAYPVIGIGSATDFDPVVLLGCLAIGVSFHVFADVGNDVADLDLDVTDPRRARSPLVSGAIRPVTGLFVVFAQLPVMYAVVAMLDGDPRRQRVGALAALSMALLLITLYNVAGKSVPVPVVADAVQGLGWAALVLLGAELSGGSTPVTLAAMGYVTVYVAFVNGVHGAVRDLRNDRAHGASTTALLLGVDLVGGSVHTTRRFVVHALLLQTALWVLLGVCAAVGPFEATGISVSIALLAAGTVSGVMAYVRRHRLREAMAMGTWHLALVPAALLALCSSTMPWWAVGVAVVAFVAPPLVHGRALRGLDFDLPSTVVPTPAPPRAPFHDRVGVLLAMTRPGTWLASGGLVLIGASFGGLAGWAAGVAAVVVALIVAAGNVYNDRCDLATDRINRPDRPLVAERIAGSTADRCVLLAGTVAVAASSRLGSLAAICAGLALVLALAYSLVLRRWLPTGAPTVALLFAAPILYGGVFASGGATGSMWLAAGVVFVFVVSRECLMGVPDVDGDRRSGYRTVAATLGERSAYWAFRVGLVAFVGLLLLPIVAGSPGAAYVVAVACFAVVPATLAIVRLGWEPDPAGVASALHTTGMVFGGGLVPLFLLIGG